MYYSIIKKASYIMAVSAFTALVMSVLSSLDERRVIKRGSRITVPENEIVIIYIPKK